MYPKSADDTVVDDLDERTVAAFKQSSGFRAATVSVDALMGPSARNGDHGRVLEADFDTIDDFMAVLHAESFADLNARTEEIGTTLLLYEVAEV